MLEPKDTPQPTNPPVSSTAGSPRRSNQTLLIVVGILAVALLCTVMLCGGLALAGGAWWFTRSRVDVALEPTAVVRQLPDTPEPAATQSADALPVTLTPFKAPATAGESVTLTPAASSSTPIPEITATALPTFTHADTARQLHIFGELWDIVNDDYVYTDFNGLDWAAVKISTELVISAGIPNEQFYELMNDVIVSLNDDHSYFLSPQEARDEDDEYQGKGEYVGIGILSDQNMTKHYAYVLQVLPDSPAQRAGIQAHDHILSIDGKPVIDDKGNLYLSLLRGPVGSQVSVTVQSPGGEARTVSVARARLPASFPVESRILPGAKRIGYVLIPTFFEEDMGDRVRDALRQLMKGGRLDGLIVDMRINNGGAYPVLMTNLGFLTTGNVGALVNRWGTRDLLNVHAERLGNSQTVPLVVLIGPSTQSYAEVYAGALRAKGRVKLIGQHSAGNIETLHGHDFEDGSEAWIAEETFRLPNGTNWEGKGLAPDVTVDKGWDEYTSENDPAISAAVTALTGGR